MEFLRRVLALPITLIGGVIATLRPRRARIIRRAIVGGIAEQALFKLLSMPVGSGAWAVSLDVWAQAGWGDNGGGQFWLNLGDKWVTCRTRHGDLAEQSVSLHLLAEVRQGSAEARAFCLPLDPGIWIGTVTLIAVPVDGIQDLTPHDQFDPFDHLADPTRTIDPPEDQIGTVTPPRPEPPKY
jgi:hypothetical protein